MNELFQLSFAFQLTWWEWAIALAAALLIGVSKAGIKGLSVLFVTMMAYAFGGKASTGIVLPLLILEIYWQCIIITGIPNGNILLV